MSAHVRKIGDDWRCEVCGGKPRFDEDGPYCPDHPEGAMSAHDELAHLEYQRREHEAWLAVGREFRALGLNMDAGGNAERLHNSIVRWGEELAQLRIHDPNPAHGENALRERRELYRITGDDA